MGTKTKKIQKEAGNLPKESVPRVRFDASRPQFHKAEFYNAKVELDDRFTSVLSDPRFQLQIVDKYGRRREGSRKEMTSEELGDFYIKKDESPRHDNCSSTSQSDAAFKQSVLKRDGSIHDATGMDSISKEKINEDPTGRIAYLNALSRGEVEFSSSSGDEGENDVNRHDDSDDDDFPSLQNESHSLGVLDPSFKTIEDMPVEFTTDESPYVAVTNADWSHLRAVDIFAIVSSFVPLGTVLRVTIYPSNFGLDRLRKEELFGPVDVFKPNSSCFEDSGKNANDDDRFNDDETGSVLDGTNDFDPEKLRLYEASRLKYYFAVVELLSARYADLAYKEVDGMEFEHSSAALDLRVIPADELLGIVANRMIKDEASALPSSYCPPDFVVRALQQSTVQCTWDIGDQHREALLTKYSVSGQTWENITENEDLKVYLGSDQSSDEDESISENRKATSLRNLLGLDSGSDDDKNEADSINGNTDEIDSDSEYIYEKQASFIPGKLDGDDQGNDQEKELTPWEKYQEKRRQKRREKRASIREKRKIVNDERKGPSHFEESGFNDDLFVANGNNILNTDLHALSSGKSEEDFNDPCFAGSVDNEMRDFDMRGLERLEKNKLKQLKGARKRKEDRLAENVVGTDFQVNTFDVRFRKVLEGTDERFGIDRTDPNFKETPAMQYILAEQSRLRKRHQTSRRTGISDNIAADAGDVGKRSLSLKSDSATLNALVVSIKDNVKE